MNKLNNDLKTVDYDFITRKSTKQLSNVLAWIENL